MERSLLAQPSSRQAGKVTGGLRTNLVGVGPIRNKAQLSHVCSNHIHVCLKGRLFLSLKLAVHVLEKQGNAGQEEKRPGSEP